MDYQKIVCWGDSQTFGARSYGNYPLYLAQTLSSETRYTWQAINISTNGHTVRDLWFRFTQDLPALKDVHQACILIGANDVGNETPIDLFEEYYRQLLTGLQLNGFKVIHCGEIPPIWPDGHAYFPVATRVARHAYNERVIKVVESSKNGNLVRLSNLTADCYTDPVHFNEAGNRVVARAFASAVMAF